MNSYGRIREKKLTAQDTILTCQNLKHELKVEMDVENRRINVDSAKKRAVLYHMDYEGFRQMVLGANLYRIKAKELRDFAIQAPVDKIMNPSQTTFNNIATLQQEVDNTSEMEQLLSKMRLLQCNNFREFRAAFQKYYHSPIDEIVINDIDILLKSQSKDNWKKIVSVDFQVQYFLDILCLYEQQLEQPDQLCFIVQLMHELSQFKDFQFQVPKFLKKSEKERINQFLESVLKTDKPDVNEDFHQILDNVVKYYRTS